MLTPYEASSQALVADMNRAPTPLREVRTSVEIDADAMRVWNAVVAFPPLPEPTDLVFRSGIAYPRPGLLSKFFDRDQNFRVHRAAVHTTQVKSS